MEKNRVVVAMSGGVDSSVTAALLLEQGFQVIGVNMLLGSGFKDGTAPDSARDAQTVAEQLNIPFHVVDYHKAFKKNVVDYFCDEYSSGRTPNPCIVCNKTIKFGKLMEFANKIGVEYIATGHYARIEKDNETGRYLLKKGIDSQKDQSYALFSLSQEQLRHIITPLGNYTKINIRKLAESLSLKVSQRPESQELCFISDKNYNKFLQEKSKDQVKPGPILDIKGNILGQHNGIQFYTIGQRKGLGAFGKPMYVLKIEPSQNAVIIGTKEELLVNKLTASSANFISIPELREEMRITAKIRYNDPGARARVIPVENQKKSFRIIFDQPRRAVTPGQAVVLYDGDTVVGGGWIE
ncbi:tRNA 2-thiouridine(34) synthase MnmA [Candidatus Poribacteria bacterium]|nr:tRNA 2-thiouridine(34) synthase MnmA [Candidatus Poribacteria bacterium]